MANLLAKIVWLDYDKPFSMKRFLCRMFGIEDKKEPEQPKEQKQETPKGPMQSEELNEILKKINIRPID